MEAACLQCLMWLPLRAGVLRVCDISGLKNTRRWVGGREEWKLQVFY